MRKVRIVITINTENASCEGRGLPMEVRNITAQAVQKIDKTMRNLRHGEEAIEDFENLFDVNGNKVGKVTIETEV